MTSSKNHTCLLYNRPESKVFDVFVFLDYGFEGSRLRKGFPLNKFIELRYDNTNKIFIFKNDSKHIFIKKLIEIEISLWVDKKIYTADFQN